MSAPLFSILIPSRDRVNLLAHALASVSRQKFADCEVVVSDNVSDQDYAACVAGFPALDVRLLRTPHLLSVTENWNNALSAARGRYILMLGDDDALAPGCLARIAEVVEAFDQPDLVYIQAYHYTYPNVLADAPAGGLIEVANSPLFDRGNEPYRLDEKEAHRFSRRAYDLRHEISFNAQHFVLKRDFAAEAAAGKFYQSPYPDFFAAIVTFRRARSIVVLPRPEIIVGIAKESFGFFFGNKREKEGFDRFATDAIDEASLTGGDPAILQALAMPGSGHWRNWFIAALFARRAVPEFAQTVPDLRRYRRIQIMELSQLREIYGQIGGREFWEAVAPLGPHAQRWARQFRRLSRAVAVNPVPSVGGAAGALRERLNIHYPARVHRLPIRRHRHIMDAYDWLESNPAKGPPPLLTRLYDRVADGVRARMQKSRML